MAKKKTTKKKTPHINEITPAVEITSGITFDSLRVGECFLMKGGLYMKEDTSPDNRYSDQCAVNLSTGVFQDSLCGKSVVPVTITINWKRRT